MQPKACFTFQESLKKFPFIPTFLIDRLWHEIYCCTLLCCSLKKDISLTMYVGISKDKDVKKKVYSSRIFARSKAWFAQSAVDACSCSWQWKNVYRRRFIRKQLAVHDTHFFNIFALLQSKIQSIQHS